MRLALAVILGILLGIIGARFLFVGSSLSLLPWAVMGLGIGWFCQTRKEALINGAVYGFVLSFVFMLAGYNGTRSIITVVPFFILLGVFGGVCGLVLSYIGFIFRTKLKK